MMNDVRVGNIDSAALFAAGVYKSAVDHGMSHEDAENFSLELCKTAGHLRYVEDDEDDNSTWWGRNSSWALPTIVGTLAFMLGNDAGRSGRPDWSSPRNAWELFKRRFQDIIGVIRDPHYRSMVDATKPDPAVTEGLDGTDDTAYNAGYAESHAGPRGGI